MAVMVIMETRGNTEPLLAAADEIRRRSGNLTACWCAWSLPPTRELCSCTCGSPSKRALYGTQTRPTVGALAASGIAGLTREPTVREYTTDMVQIFDRPQDDR
jgi:hypothetical protein